MGIKVYTPVHRSYISMSLCFEGCSFHNTKVEDSIQENSNSVNLNIHLPFSNSYNFSCMTYVRKTTNIKIRKMNSSSHFTFHNSSCCLEERFYLVEDLLQVWGPHPVSEVPVSRVREKELPLCQHGRLDVLLPVDVLLASVHHPHVT